MSSLLFYNNCNVANYLLDLKEKSEIKKFMIWIKQRERNPWHSSGTDHLKVFYSTLTYNVDVKVMFII